MLATFIQESYCQQYYYAERFHMIANQSAKSHETFPPQVICNIRHLQVCIQIVYLFMKTLQQAIDIITIIHSSQILVNHKKQASRRNSETCPKRKIPQSSCPVQCSIPIVHSTICTYPAITALQYSRFKKAFHT